MASLTTRLTDTYEESYSDRGTGARSDLSVFRPIPRRGEFRVTYFAKGRGKPSFKSPVVKEDPNSPIRALAPPTNFVCKWTDKGTGAPNDGSLWEAQAPAGYIALSDVAIHMSNSGISPGTSKSASDIDEHFMCVHESLVKETELNECQWTDAGSGGKYDGACWTIKDFPGMRVSRGGGDRPAFDQYRLCNFTGALYKDMMLVFSLENPLDADQPDSSRKVTKGLTCSSGSEFGFSEEFALEIGYKASAGVEGIASSEASGKFSAQLGATQSFSSSSTSTTTDELDVHFKVPARHRVELWQLVVSDSSRGATSGSFLINSEQWELRYIPL